MLVAAGEVARVIDPALVDQARQGPPAHARGRARALDHEPGGPRAPGLERVIVGQEPDARVIDLSDLYAWVVTAATE